MTNMVLIVLTHVVVMTVRHAPISSPVSLTGRRMPAHTHSQIFLPPCVTYDGDKIKNLEAYFQILHQFYATTSTVLETQQYSAGSKENGCMFVCPTAGLQLS